MLTEVFPEEIGRTAQRTIKRNAVVVANKYGFRQNFSNDPDGGLRVYNFPRRLLTDTDFNEIRDFFIGTNIGTEGFLFTDWKDNQVDEGYQATGDGVEDSFNAIKRYELGTGVDIDRRIYYIDDTTLRVFFDTVEQFSGFSWNSTTLQVDFTSPIGSGVVYTASFDFYVPVVFATELANTNDYLSISDYEAITLEEFIPDV